MLLKRFATNLAFAAIVFSFSINRASAADDPIFDVPALTTTPLNPRVLKSSEHDGIVTEEVRFHSEKDGDTDVDIFAFFSYPKGAKGLPAYIWNPGGLGQASPAFTEVGAKRGYATLCIDFPQPGYRSTGNYPINTGLVVGDDPKRAPIYHGAVALLKAVSYLESRPEVDKDRIGMAGSSWGGFFTTLMCGIDPRLKACACLYGCGNLQLGNAWWDGGSRNSREAPTPEERERWRTTLDPALRLPTKKTPIAWITGTNDRFYALPAVQKSYEMAAGPKHLTIVPNWDHALPEFISDETYLAWLDEHLQEKKTLVSVTPLVIEKVGSAGDRMVSWTFEGDIVSAELYESFGEPGNWAYRFWHTMPVKVEETMCSASLTGGKKSVPRYLLGSVVGTNGLRTSTQILLIEPERPQGSEPLRVPGYNGCTEWASFEKKHLAYLKRHDQSGQKRWVPRVRKDPAAGEQAAILEPGTNTLPPVLCTPDVRHRFHFMCKSPKPVTVTVQLGDEKRSFEVGTDWTDCRMGYTPAMSLMGGFPATITVPQDATRVLVDDFYMFPNYEDE